MTIRRFADHGLPFLAGSAPLFVLLALLTLSSSTLKRAHASPEESATFLSGGIGSITVWRMEEGRPTRTSIHVLGHAAPEKKEIPGLEIEGEGKPMIFSKRVPPPAEGEPEGGEGTMAAPADQAGSPSGGRPRPLSGLVWIEAAGAFVAADAWSITYWYFDGEVPVRAVCTSIRSNETAPPRFEARSRVVTVRPGSWREEIVPAKYETRTKSVVVLSADESPTGEAIYEEVEEEVVVEPKRFVRVFMPPIYETVEDAVLVESAKVHHDLHVTEFLPAPEKTKLDRFFEPAPLEPLFGDRSPQAAAPLAVPAPAPEPLPASPELQPVAPSGD